MTFILNKIIYKKLINISKVDNCLTKLTEICTELLEIASIEIQDSV